MLRDDPNVEVGAINCERAENRKICADWLAVDAYPSLYLLNMRHHTLAKYPKDADKSAERVREWALETAREWRYLFETASVVDLRASDFGVRLRHHSRPRPRHSSGLAFPCRPASRSISACLPAEGRAWGMRSFIMWCSPR